jgi:hypothetical protein
MAKVKSNVLVRGLSGKFADQVVFRHMKDGRTIVADIPDFSNRELSPDQKEHHERFRQAAAYAKPASKSEPLYAKLAAGTAKNAYNIAFGDWFNPPVIQSVDIADGVIRILAHDDVRVVGVRVMILDGEGKVLEQGEAVLLDGDQWEYMPTATGKVVVDARDMAGNVTSNKDEG